METKDPLFYYEAIGKALLRVAPPGWSSIHVEIALDGLRVDAVVSYELDGSTGYLTGVPRLATYFYDLARVVSTEEKGLFKKCSFSLHDSERYDVNFTY